MRKVKEWEARQTERLAKLCSLDFGGDKAPAPQPDPGIGRAAEANSEVAKEMQALSREEFEYRKTRDAKMDPVYSTIIDSGIESERKNQARADEQWAEHKSTWQPIEEKYAAEIQKLGSPEEQEAAAGRAVQDINARYDVADASSRRNLARVGGTGGGAYEVGERLAGLSRAGATAASATGARTSAKLLGVAALESGAKFGRGLPSTGIAADSLAINAGNAAGNAGVQQDAVHNAGVSTAGNFLTGAVGANNSAGSLLTNQFNQQNTAYQNSMNANKDAWSGIGTVVGGLAGAYFGGPAGAMAGAKIGGSLGRKDGGIVRRPRMLAYADGGAVEGPGGPRDDAIHATVDGVPGVRLSDGEYVIKADSVMRYGPRLLNAVNEGTAIIIPPRSPRSLRAVA